MIFIISFFHYPIRTFLFCYLWFCTSIIEMLRLLGWLWKGVYIKKSNNKIFQVFNLNYQKIYCKIFMVMYLLISIVDFLWYKNPVSTCNFNSYFNYTWYFISFYGGAFFAVHFDNSWPFVISEFDPTWFPRSYLNF